MGSSPLDHREALASAGTSCLEHEAARTAHHALAEAVHPGAVTGVGLVGALCGHSDVLLSTGVNGKCSSVRALQANLDG